MNTKDRKYLENLTQSIAVTNQSFILLGETVKRSIEEVNVKLKLLSEQIAKLNLDAIGETPTQRELDKETLDYNGWGVSLHNDWGASPQPESGVFKEEEEEVHSMIKNNKFVDDGSMFQDEDDQTPRVAPAPRKRGSWEANLIEKTCSRCNKTEKINKIHATSFNYTCRRCVRR